MTHLSLYWKNGYTSLLDWEDGINLHDWTQATPSTGGPTIETLGLRVRGTSTNNVADILQSIDQKIRESTYYFSGIDLYPVWLYAGAVGETELRRAMVLNMQGSPGRSMMDYVFSNTHQLNEYTLAVERVPFWEDVSRTNYSISQRPAHKFELGTTIGGDAPARIDCVDISGWQAYKWSEVWLGFRTDRLAPRANFDPEITFTEGFGRVDTTITGGVASCAFVTETLQERVYLRMKNLSGMEAYYRGEFQVLLLASVGSGMTVNLRLKHGFYTDDNEATDNTWIAHDNRVQLTSTSVQLLDMGVVRIPFTRGVESNTFFEGHALCFDAELISGSGTLTMSKIILIPRNEGFLYLKAGVESAYATITTADIARIYTHPDGSVEGHWYDDGVPGKALELSTSNWSLPVGDSLVCWAANRTAANGGYVAGHELNLAFRYFQRWRTLKGAG